MLRKKRFVTILVLAVLLLSACQLVVPTSTELGPEAPTLPEGGAIAQVNDIEMYYEIRGEGEPLLLIHGAIGSTEDFAQVIPAFAEEGYQAIAVDCRGRGRSTDSGQPLSYALMASDIMALMDKLGIDKANIAGQSDGAIIGLHMAIHYPERVNKLVSYGANFNTDGLMPGFVDLVNNITLADFDAMTGEDYRRLSPDPDHLPVMLEKIRHMLLTQPNFTLEQLMSIRSPVLVFDGEEEDTVRVEHASQLAAAIPNSTLVIQPGTGHHLMYEQPEVYLDTVLPFLAGELEVPQAGKYTVPRFEPAECKYPDLAEANAECGYLIVPEDRSNPDSPTIRVHVIKFLSASENPAPDPIIVIPGGPGAPGAFYAWVWSALPVGEVMRAERDVYLLETRGAMYSEPAFYCPELEIDWTELVSMSMAEEAAWTADAYRACHDRLVKEGVNFSAYGILDIAGDVADLRTALGYDEVNVYGVSYGTPPAMLLMRERPEGVRSVILDSISPPDVVRAEKLLENTQAAFDATSAACAADPACNAAYPDLKAVFSDVLAQLRQEPATVTVTDEAGQEYTVTVDDVKFVHFAYDSIFIGDGFTSLPANIYAAYSGDLQAPTSTWLGYVSGQHGPATPEAWAWAKGMTYAAECLQDGSATDLATVTALYAQADVEPSVRDWALIFHTLEEISPCEYWEVTPPEPNIAIEPVTSDLPALMLTGTFDPNTPPSLSRAAAERLPNSFFYELPSGHALIFTDCGLELITQFLADPTQTPDASCIDEMMPNWVLPE